jgi:hypothetical protein
MCEYTTTIRFAVGSIDSVTMERPAADCCGGEQCDAIAAVVAAQHGFRADTAADRDDGDSTGVFANGGQVAIKDASDSVSSPHTNRTDEPSAATDTAEPRTQRAHEEEMDVSLLRKGGIYEVRSASGTDYEVDIADGSCTCLDWQRREPDGGCKHLRRVDMAVKAGTVPRPDGRLPERAVTADGHRDGTLVTDANRIADRIHALDAAIERQRAERDGLRAALATIEAVQEPQQSDGEDERGVE